MIRFETLTNRDSVTHFRLAFFAFFCRRLAILSRGESAVVCESLLFSRHPRARRNGRVSDSAMGTKFRPHDRPAMKKKRARGQKMDKR